MSRKDFPQKIGPLEQNVAYVEGVQDPGPLVTVETKSDVGSSCFGIAYVATIQVRQHIEDADQWQNVTVKLCLCKWE
jgi:hypothetical protein